MGLSSFLKRGNEQPPESAFDAIPDEVRQAIANDMLAIIECIKAWRAAVASPEHGKAMIDEAKVIGRKLGGKLVAMAMTGSSDVFDSPDWYEKLGLPAAIIDIIARVKSGMDEKPSIDNEPSLAPGIGTD